MTIEAGLEQRVFARIGVPTLSYGFPTGYTGPGGPAFSSVSDLSVSIADMINTAKLYASITLDLCNRPVGDPP